MAKVVDARLTVDGTTRELTLERATVGNDGVSVATLLRDTELVTVDPGFMNTASCESAITYIDGDNGILRYRGYPIEQLAKHSTFLEVAYLLIHGELPSSEEFEAFNHRVSRHMHVHEGIKAFLGAFPRDAHPMAVLSGATSALSTFYPESVGRDEDAIDRLAHSSPSPNAHVPTTHLTWSHKPIHPWGESSPTKNGHMPAPERCARTMPAVMASTEAIAAIARRARDDNPPNSSTSVRSGSAWTGAPV